jgi:hypothetical protein
MDLAQRDQGKFRGAERALKLPAIARDGLARIPLRETKIEYARGAQRAATARARAESVDEPRNVVERIGGEDLRPGGTAERPSGVVRARWHRGRAGFARAPLFPRRLGHDKINFIAFKPGLRAVGIIGGQASPHAVIARGGRQEGT